MSWVDVYQVNDAVCLSHCLSHTHSSFCSPMHSPSFQSFTHPLIVFLSLLLYFSLSLSFSFFLSFSPLHSLTGFLSQAFCLSFSFFNTQTLAHTQSYALSHPPTHKCTHAPNLYVHFSCTLTHISLSFSLFPSLFLSLSLTHIH